MDIELNQPYFDPRIPRVIIPIEKDGSMYSVRVHDSTRNYSAKEIQEHCLPLPKHMGLDQFADALLREAAFVQRVAQEHRLAANK